MQCALRAAAVMWFGRRSAVRARAGQRWCKHAARRRERRARLPVQAARRWHSLLHRCQTMQPNTPRGSDLHRNFSRSVHSAYIDAMHARGGAGDCETRRCTMCLGQSPRAESNARRVRGQSPLFFGPVFIRSKADTGPEGGIPQIAPAEHALVTRHRRSFCSGTDAAATHGNVRSVFGPRLLRTTNEAVAALVTPS